MNENDEKTKVAPTLDQADKPSDESPPKPKKKILRKVLLVSFGVILVGIIGYLVFIQLTLKSALNCGLGPCPVDSKSFAEFQKDAVDKARVQAIHATNNLANLISTSDAKLIASSHEDYCGEFDGGGNGDFSTHFDKKCSYIAMLYFAYPSSFSSLHATLLQKLEGELRTNISPLDLNANCVTGNGNAESGGNQIEVDLALSPFPPPQVQDCQVPLPWSTNDTTLSGIGAPGPIFTLKEPLSYTEILNKAKSANPASFLSVTLTNNYFSQALPSR